jgi:hypothetical protein
VSVTGVENLDFPGIVADTDCDPDIDSEIPSIEKFVTHSYGTI